MSREKPPKGSTEWFANQNEDEESLQSAAKGTLQATTGQTTTGETSPKGTATWAVQNQSEGGTTGTPGTTTAQDPTSPQQQLAPPELSAHREPPASVNPITPAVMGYDLQIAALREAVEKSKPETEEERKQRERKERSKKIISAVGDGLMALSNLYYTTRGAPNMYDHKTMSQQSPLQEHLDKLKAEREANAERYRQYALKIGDLQNDKAKTLREMELEHERRKLAREKAQREEEKQRWIAALQDDKVREQKGKADKATMDAKTAEAKAKYASAQEEAKLGTEKARGNAQRASAANSMASARSHNRSNPKEFSAWDQNGREYRFSTQSAAEQFAKQHGTYQESTTETTSEKKTPQGKSLGQTVTTKQGKGYPRVQQRPAKQAAHNNANAAMKTTAISPKKDFAKGLKF